MQSYTCPARYRRHVEAAIAIAIAEVGRDVACRDDDDERVQDLAPVRPELIGQEDGTLRIVVGVEEGGTAVVDVLLTAGATV